MEELVHWYMGTGPCTRAPDVPAAKVEGLWGQMYQMYQMYQCTSPQVGVKDVAFFLTKLE